MVIGVAVVSMLPVGKHGAPSAKVIHMDIDDNEVITVAEYTPPAYGRVPSLRGRTYAGIAVVGAVVVLAILISKISAHQRRKPPPEFLKKP